jgi:hypothetical protein
MTEGTSSSKNSGHEAFPGLTGRGVRVAVIDSGVNPQHPGIQNVSGGVAIGTGQSMNPYVDSVGHGTAVLGTIQDKAPDAEFYVIKIYDRSLRTDINMLISALHWAIGDGADVINVSVGALSAAYYDRFIPVIRRANDTGSLVVAAAAVDSTPFLPGSLPGVIGVELDCTCPRHTFRMDPFHHSPRWLTSGCPRRLPGIAPRDKLRGLSLSVANMTGFVARAREKTKKSSFEGICKALQEEVERLALIKHPIGSS